MWTALLLLPLAQTFTPQTIATGLKGGYQVVLADMNRDRRPDLIALASGLTELLWLENPGKPDAAWPRHVLLGGQSRMINCAARDTDGDGLPEIVLAAQFDNQPKNSIGGVSLLRSGPDPAAPWTQVEIDRLTTSHRIRWMDRTGKGDWVAINAPLAGFGAEAPEFRARVPLVFYRPGAWKRETIHDANEGVVHGILVDGQRLLTASFLGVHAHRWTGTAWTREEITKGDPSPWPKSGASDVATGKDFLAAIEPWHGHQVVVYRKGKREVIDTTLDTGHTIQVWQGSTIVAGHRGQKAHGVNLYRHSGRTWQKTVLDGAISANSCEVGDLNGDGRADIACIGGATEDLKVYFARP